MKYFQGVQAGLQVWFAVLQALEELILADDFGAFGDGGFDFKRFDYFPVLQEADFEEVGLVPELEGSSVGDFFFEGWEGGQLYDEGGREAAGRVGVLGGPGGGVSKLQAAFPDAAAALQLGDSGGDSGFEGDVSGKEVGLYAQEVLVPYAEMFGIGPGLQEGTGDFPSFHSVAGQCVGIFAEAADGSFLQGLPVHAPEEGEGRFRLSGFEHALQGDSVEP